MNRSNKTEYASFLSLMRYLFSKDVHVELIFSSNKYEPMQKLNFIAGRPMAALLLCFILFYFFFFLFIFFF